MCTIFIFTIGASFLLLHSAYLAHSCKRHKSPAIALPNIFNLHHMSVQAQIHEGKEPAQFFSILHRLVIFKVCAPDWILKLCLVLKKSHAPNSSFLFL